MTALELTLFGSPRLKIGGQDITNKITGKALALFVYLAVTGQPQRRDVLADLLWSEYSNQEARNNLRYQLPDLRQVLGNYLLITTQTISFNSQSNYWLDVEVLRTSLDAEGQQFNAQSLQAALDLYQAEFLAGFAVRNAPVFEAWMARQREALHQSAVQGFYTLAELYQQQGDYRAALATTQRLLHWAPWHEAGYRLQMQLLVATGHRTAALVQYTRCRGNLADELGVEPEATTVALYEQIRRSHADQSACTKSASTERAHPQCEQPSTHVPAQAKSNVPLDLASELEPLHNLPSQLTQFFGREREIADLSLQLHKEDARLITLVGEGGVGKTRLALAVAQALLEDADAPQALPVRRLSSSDVELTLQASPKSKNQNQKFPDGIWFVPLGSITTAGELATQFPLAVAKAIGLQFSGQRPLLTQLFAYLQDKALLLLLDNAEHLLPELTDLLVELLQTSPRTTLLVTSRHLLNLQAEFVWPVIGLAVPVSSELTKLTPAAVERYSGIALFVERAKRAQRNFQMTAENQAEIIAICRFVEGLPLAIELAAALTKQYGCAELYKALQRDYRILSTSFADLSPRHRSIKAMLDYSWQFLTPEEAHTLAACSIFAGGFTREAALAVTGATPLMLTKFVDQSLLQMRGGRFAMHKLMRQYAAEQLAQTSKQQAAAFMRHARYYIDLLQGLEAQFLIDVGAQAVVQRDLDNIRIAWRWSIEQCDLALLAKGTESLYYFYRLAGLYGEAIQLFEAAARPVGELVSVSAMDAEAVALLARLLYHTAEFYRRLDKVAIGERLAQEALKLGKRLANPTLQGWAYHELARLAYARSNALAMHTLAEAGCKQARQAGAPYLIAECLNDLGIAVSVCHGPLIALPHFHEALTLLQSGTNLPLEAFVLVNLGFFSLANCQYQAAHTYLQRGVTLQHLLQDRGGRLPPLIHLCNLYLALGNGQGAQRAYAEALRLAPTIGNARWESQLQASYGRWQHLNGDLPAARTACTHAQHLAQQSGAYLEEQRALIYLGHVLTESGEFEAANQSYQKAIALHKADNWLYRTAEAYAGLGLLLLTQNEVADAVTQAEAALELLAQYGLAAANEPFMVYWACVRVLMTAGDPRTTEVLRTAYERLQEIAHQLSDVTLRHSFLENLPCNRELNTFARQAGLVQS